MFFLGATASSKRAIEISDRHFGAVATQAFASSRPDLGGLKANTALDKAISEMGFKSLRFPGGTEGESFSWRSVDQKKEGFSANIQDLHNAIDYCAENGLELSFTFPSREFEGVNLALERAELIDFFKTDLLGYANSKGVTVSQIKIGNEYYIEDQISPEIYGEIAAELTHYVGIALGDGNEKTDVLIEAGIVWSTGWGNVDGNTRPDYVDIQTGFGAYLATLGAAERDRVISYLDGVDTHSNYTSLRIDYDNYFGVGMSVNGFANLSIDELYQQISLNWSSGAGLGWVPEDLELHNLAWSYDRIVGEARDEGASLENAAMAVLQFHAMSLAGVESSFVWTPVGWSGNSLLNLSLSESKAGGTIISLMEDSLAGMTAIEFESDPSHWDGTPSNQSDEDVAFRAFEGANETVLYVANLRGEDDRNFTIDVCEMFESHFSSVSAIRLGVVKGANPTDPTSQVETTAIDQNSLSTQGNDDVLSFQLDGHEVLQITFSNEGPSDTTTYDQVGIGSIGSDFLFGESGNDKLYGKGEKDYIYAGGGDDFLNGGRGDDFLFGGAGNDRFYGMEGEDHIYGGDGNDVLDGGLGDDFLFGGDGHDHFYFEAKSGADEITDFSSEDVLELDGFLSENQSLNSAIGTDENGTLTISNGVDIITFEGLVAADSFWMNVTVA